MTISAKAATALVLSAAVLGWSGVARATDPEDVVVLRGMMVAKRNCSQCHSLAVGEKSPNPKAPPFHDLHHRFPGDSLEAALDRGLLTHTRDMPQLRLTPSELRDLKAYFRTLQAEGEQPAAFRPDEGPAVRLQK